MNDGSKTRLDSKPSLPTSGWRTSLEEGKKTWLKEREDCRFPSNLTLHTKNLYNKIGQCLKEAAEDGTEGWNEAVQQVEQLLLRHGPEDKTKIDSCIRWLILLELANSEWHVKYEKANLQILKLLVGHEPFLAFENPYSKPKEDFKSSGSNIYARTCRDSNKHWKIKEKSTPFHKAAECGNSVAVKHMVESLVDYCKHATSKDLDTRPLFSHLPSGTLPPPDVVGVLQRRDITPRTGKRALQLAAESKNKGNLETLDILLSYKGIVDAEDTTFREAIDAGKVDVIDKFLERQSEQRHRLVASDNLIRAMDSSNLQVVNKLLDKPTEAAFDRNVVDRIIQKGLKDVWTKRPRSIAVDTTYLLHLAVFYQQEGFVGTFVKDYPKSIVSTYKMPDTDEKTYYPLWYNNKRWDRTKWVDRDRTATTESIRAIITTATIRQTDKMQELSQILQQSAERVRELCFDISRINFKSYRVSEFVRSLVSHSENEGLLLYERTIKYVRFPAMDMHPDEKEVRFSDMVTTRNVEHREVFDVLDWLKQKKEVMSIIELKVPDRLVKPHDELKIAKYVIDFQVEILDWRFLDMGLSTFEEIEDKRNKKKKSNKKDDVKGRIRGLHLYSSGKRAVISHWMSPEGLPSFSNLSWVRIHVIKDMMTPRSCNGTLRYLNRKLTELKKLPNLKELDCTYTAEPWNPTHERLADLEELSQRAFPSLAQFIDSYRTYIRTHKPSWPTRVAILDNGIMSMSPVANETFAYKVGDGGASHAKKPSSVVPPQHLHNGERKQPYTGVKHDRTDRDPDGTHNSDGEHFDVDDEADADDGAMRQKSNTRTTLWSRISEGKSFVDDDYQLSPWLFASDPHGTQMANLICAIDPGCQLYVAQVTDGRYGITPHRVKEAIDWAVEKKVDIISMSFAMMESTTPLKTAVANAHAQGIVMLCSTHDEGPIGKQSYPADATETLGIMACDEYGKSLRSEEVKHDFLIQGRNVPAGVIPFLDSEDRVSGSSVATAIAAGLSSLITSCVRLANKDMLFEGVSRREVIEKFLKDMGSEQKAKYLILERFARIDKKTDVGERPNAAVIISNVFLESSWKS